MALAHLSQEVGVVVVMKMTLLFAGEGEGEQAASGARARAGDRSAAHTYKQQLTHLCKKVLHSKFLVCCAASVAVAVTASAAVAGSAAAFGLCSLSFRSIQVGNFNFKLE